MADAISIQELIDARTDAKTLEEAVNGDAVTTVLSRLGETYPTLSNALNQIDSKLDSADTQIKQGITNLFENGGLPATPFKTKALMTASSLANDSYAMVTDDTANNGLYVKTAGAWVNSGYDPLTQAKAYTDSEKTSAINIAATDATTKASAAKTEAIAAAAIDAENKVKAEVSKIAEFNSVGNTAYLFTDKNDVVLGALNSNAEFEANDFKTKTGSLNEAIAGSAETVNVPLAYALGDKGGNILWGLTESADVISPYPPLQGLGVDAVRGKILSNDDLNSAGRYLDKLASKDDKPINFEVLVAENGEGGRGHCRIGSIHQINTTRFYVTYQQYDTINGEIGGTFRARFIDVDFDNESAVVGDVRTLSIFGSRPHSGNAHFTTNKDEVLMVLYNEGDMVTLVSTDECMTWSEVGRYNPLPSAFAPGLDCMVKIADGEYKDRIVVTGFVPNIGDAGFGLQCIYSDDFGRTWTVGYRFDPRIIGWGKNKNETSVTTDCNNDLVFIVRDETASPDMRKMFFGKSKDGGKTFTVFEPERDTWAEPCPFGIAQAAPNVWDGIPKILVSYPSAPNRKGLKLLTSYNGCASWANEFQLLPESIMTGYTYLNALTSKFYAIVYEHGGFNANSNVSIKFINTGAIYHGASI